MNTTADIAEPSQTVRVQLRLRELILGGELKPGARIAELTLVERLNASRTPIRMALVRLQEEGLLEALPHGGYAVKDFSEADIHDAIELRGTLEGLCARLAAERGVTTVLMSEARDCVEQIDALLAVPSLSEESFGGFVLARSTGPDARDALVVAQAQHRAVLDAIRQREGARAESLMREHARNAHANLRAALADHGSWQRVPGASLIRRRPNR
jgi:GntR family transcriptional regulator of vanillate catabolism